MAIPDSDDHEYHMLISNTGAYKTPFIIDKQAGTAALPGYTEKVWNQTGPAGPAGAPGVAGEPGPQGEPGINGSSDFYIKRLVINQAVDMTNFETKEYHILGDSDGDMLLNWGWNLYPDSDPLSPISNQGFAFGIFGVGGGDAVISGQPLSGGKEAHYKTQVDFHLTRISQTTFIRFVHLTAFGVFAKISP